MIATHGCGFDCFNSPGRVRVFFILYCPQGQYLACEGPAGSPGVLDAQVSEKRVSGAINERETRVWCPTTASRPWDASRFAVDPGVAGGGAGRASGDEGAREAPVGAGKIGEARTVAASDTGASRAPASRATSPDRR